MKTVIGKSSNAARLGVMVAAFSAVLVASAFAFEYETERDEMTFKAGEVEGIEVYLGLKTSGRFQYLDQEDVFKTPRPSDEDPTPSPVEEGSLDPGFQTAWGSMDFLFEYKEYIKVYWEFFISSRPHPDSMQGSQGYLLVQGLPNDVLSPFFNLFDVKAGEFEVNFGDHIYRRTDNARALRNPLIGNYVMDPRSTEIGIEVSTKPMAVNGLVGMTSGTAEGNFESGGGTGLHGKLWGNPTDNSRLSTSIYWVDHSDNGTGFPGGGTKNNLFSTSRSGGPYDSVIGGGNAPGQVFVGKGQEVLAAQIDATIAFGALELYSHFGYTQDSDVNGEAAGTPEDSWFYYAAEAVYDFTQNAYGAARYSAAQADSLGDSSSSGRVDRGQVGLGYWLVPSHLLAKVEYVYQQYSSFDPGEVVSSVDAWRDPSFHGVIAEVNFAF